MSAGFGIMHSDYNHSKEKPLRLLQMRVFVNKKDLEPSREQQKFSKQERTNKLLSAIVPENYNTNRKTLHVYQDVIFYLSTLTGEGIQINQKLKYNLKAYLFVINGKIDIYNRNNGNNIVYNTTTMETRDAAKIEKVDNLDIEVEKSTELILLIFPRNLKSITK